MFDVNCEGSDATFWATSLDQNFNEHQGIKTKCSVEKRNLTLTVDRLDSENEYNFTVHAANKTVTEASIIRGSIPTPIRSNKLIMPKSVMHVSMRFLLVPSIKAQLTEVSDLSATLSWSIDLDDCFVSKSINFTFSAIDSKFIKPESKILNKEECMKNRKVTLKVPLKPYREFNLTAMTCNGKNECGGNISLWGRTKAAGKHNIY